MLPLSGPPHGIHDELLPSSARNPNRDELLHPSSRNPTEDLTPKRIVEIAEMLRRGETPRVAV